MFWTCPEESSLFIRGVKIITSVGVINDTASGVAATLFRVWKLLGLRVWERAGGSQSFAASVAVPFTLDTTVTSEHTSIQTKALRIQVDEAAACRYAQASAGGGQWRSIVQAKTSTRPQKPNIWFVLSEKSLFCFKISPSVCLVVPKHIKAAVPSESKTRPLCVVWQVGTVWCPSADVRRALWGNANKLHVINFAQGLDRYRGHMARCVKDPIPRRETFTRFNFAC